MITLILIIPIIGSIIILLQSHFNTSIPLVEKGVYDLNTVKDNKKINLISVQREKKIALTTSLINLFVSLIL
jgi:hypothetical protein